MASKFKDLLIRLGLDDKQFQAQFTKIERQLTRFSNNAQRVGKSLTTNVTLPLTLAAGAAVKTFADFDRLEKGLDVFADTSTSGAEELNRLLDVVRDARTTLDLKSAANASLQLQAVGISADRARETIKQLGIAATVSGSQAEDIGEITRQFAQALSVGRVLEQDLRIIKSRIPAIGKVLQDEFGTVTAEGLRAANISADEFVDRLTKAIATNQKFQNVQISLAKAIETFSVNMQIATSRIGQLISETLNLPALLDRVTTQIDRFTVFLDSLSESHRRAIIQVGLFLAAIGPISFVVGGTLKSILGLINGLGGLVISLISIPKSNVKTIRSLRLLGQTSLATSRGLFLLGAAIRSAIVPLAVISAAVVGLKLVFDRYSDSVARANQAQDAIRKAQAESKNVVRQNREELDKYILLLESENTSNSAKIKALDQLNQLTNNAFAGVKILANETVGLTKAQDDYFSSLERETEILELRKEQKKLEEGIKLTKLMMTQGQQATGQYAQGLGDGANAANQFSNSLQGLDNTELKKLEKDLEIINNKIASLAQQQFADNTILEAEKLKEYISTWTQALEKDLEKADVLGKAFNTEKIEVVRQQLDIVKKAFEAAYDNENLRENDALQTQLTAKLRQLESQLKSLETATFFADLNKQLDDIQKKGLGLGVDQQLISQEQLDALQQGLEKAISLDAPIAQIDKLKRKIDEIRTELAGDPIQPIDARSNENIKIAVGSLDDMGGYYANINGKIKEVNKETYEFAELTKKAQQSSKDVELNWDKVLQAVINNSSGLSKVLLQNFEAVVSGVRNLAGSIVDSISDAFSIKKEAREDLAKAEEELRKLRSSGEASASEIENIKDRILELNETIQNTNLFSAIGESIKQLVVEIGKAIAKALIFAGILTLLGSAFPALGALLPTGPGAFGKLFLSGLFGSQVPLANGGLVYGPVNALVGEGAGTNRRNPEVVAPLDKLKAIIGDTEGNGFVASTRLTGSDLLLVVERAKRQRDR